jgi:hypothetical protein
VQGDGSATSIQGTVLSLREGERDIEPAPRGLSQTFPDQCASCVRRRYSLTFGYRFGFQTPEFLSIVGSIQVWQSATPLQIVRRKTLRQAQKSYLGRCPGMFLIVTSGRQRISVRWRQLQPPLGLRAACCEKPKSMNRWRAANPPWSSPLSKQ